MKVSFSRFSWLTLFVIIASMFVGYGTSASAATIACNTDALITAINAANISSNADIIDLDGSCIYILGKVDNSDDYYGDNGLPVITSEMTINGNGAVILRSDATDTPKFRLLHVSTKANLTINHLTLKNGFANYGGGIKNDGILALTKSTVSDNSAATYGGGIYNKSNASLTIQQSSISNNSANYGGGIYNDRIATLKLQQSTLSSNAASQNGGGIANNSGTIVVEQSTLSTNSAGTGGAIENRNDGMVVMKQSTLNSNSADTGGGVANFFGGTLTLELTIIAGNSAVNSAEDVISSGTITSQGYNLIGNNNSVVSTFPEGRPNFNNDYVGTVYMPIDPLLRELGNYGGYTQTHLPLLGSPLIDAGSITSSFTTDQRGLARIQGSRVDIGAVEAKITTLYLPFFVQTNKLHVNLSDLKHSR